MGQFIFKVDAVGNHGAERDIGDGGDLTGEEAHTIDRILFKAVEDLKASGCSVAEAKLVHWPGQPSEVTDDLLTKTRTGSF